MVSQRGAPLVSGHQDTDAARRRPLERDVASGHCLCPHYDTALCPHRVFCSQIPDMPRTITDKEHACGQMRSPERRATGRNGACPGLVVHGAVRVHAALATHIITCPAHALAPHAPQAWRGLRAQVAFRNVAVCHRAFTRTLVPLWLLVRSHYSRYVCSPRKTPERKREGGGRSILQAEGGKKAQQ